MPEKQHTITEIKYLRRDSIRNTQIREEMGIQSLMSRYIQTRQMSWRVNIQRMPDNRRVKQIYVQGKDADEKVEKKTEENLDDVITKMIQSKIKTYNGARVLAKDTAKWKKMMLSEYSSYGQDNIRLPWPESVL